MTMRTTDILSLYCDNLQVTQGCSSKKLTSPANLMEKTEMEGTKFSWIHTQCVKHTPKCEAWAF